MQELCELSGMSQANVSKHLSLLSEQGICLLYTSDAADERSSVDLGGRRIIKKKNNNVLVRLTVCQQQDN